MSLEGQHLGEFEILERLGQGGMGAVYKARQKSLRRTVALKTLQASLAEDAEYIARFEQEAVAAAGLSHPNLVQVYSAGENDGLHWFAMEYIEGESAKVRLTRKGRLDPLEAIAIAIHVASALEYGWRKAALIHRDIKPDNIFLSEDGEVKLGDLGLAKSAGQTQGLTVTGASMGTPHYISPEQVQAMKTVDLRADIYSLGCTLYHLLSGRPPYTGDSAVAIMFKHVSAPVPNLRGEWPECPPELAAVVMKMMLKPPEARLQNYAEVNAELRRVYDLLSGTSVPSGVAVTQKPTAVEKKRGAPVGAWAGSGVALLAAIAALVYFALWKKGGENSGGTRSSASQTSSAPAPPAGSDGRAGAHPSDATKDAPFVNSLGMKFVPVPIPGRSPNSDLPPSTSVLFSVWDTRVQDYAAYAGAKKVDDSWTKQHREGVPVGRELNHPVVGVNWEDAQAFCQWLTEKEQAEGTLPKGLKYRLPSDEEWSWVVGIPRDAGTTPAEKAGKNIVDFPWGKDYPPTKKVGNYADESFHAKFPKDGTDKTKDQPWLKGYDDGYATTSPVGSFPANAYGLYDMGGNVWQWCEDWYDASHKERVLRGAGWGNHDLIALLSSNRSLRVPGDRNYYSGFRCVLAPVSSTLPAVTAPIQAESNTPITATTDQPFVNTLGMKFVPVPILGGPTGGQRVLFSVWDTRVQDYAEFVKETQREWPKVDFEQGPTHPAVNVSWEDAQLFCQWLTGREQAAGRLPAGFSYRLPSDHEWSCAVGLGAREDTAKLPSEKDNKISDTFPWGTEWPPPKGAGNYAGEELQPALAAGKFSSVKGVIAGYNDGFVNTSPVGSFAANRFGLFDMGGNVRQWCEDWYDKEQKERVLRGAAWAVNDRYTLLSSYRTRYVPGLRNSYYGFRCVVGASAR